MTGVSDCVRSISPAWLRGVALTATAILVLAVTACTGHDGETAVPAGAQARASTPPAIGGQAVSLLIHCGIKFTQFEGATWEAIPPIPSIPTTTTDAATGLSGNRYFIAGTMSRISSNEAEFVTTDDPADVHIRFELSHATVPGCA